MNEGKAGKGVSRFGEFRFGGTVWESVGARGFGRSRRLGPGQGYLLFDSADDRPHGLVSRGSLGFVFAAATRGERTGWVNWRAIGGGPVGFEDSHLEFLVPLLAARVKVNLREDVTRREERAVRQGLFARAQQVVLSLRALDLDQVAHGS